MKIGARTVETGIRKAPVERGHVHALGLAGDAFQHPGLTLPAVEPERVVLVGVRSLDPAERALIREKARLIFFGTFPFDQQWRPFFAVIIMLAMLVMTSDRRMWRPWRLAAIWSIGSFFTFLLMFGQLHIPLSLFLAIALVIGLVGTAAGTLAGCTLIFILDRYQLIRVPIDVYQISFVPFTLLPLDLLAVVAAAVLICFVATIYPSRLAPKLDPALALRYQ